MDSSVVALSHNEELQPFSTPVAIISFSLDESGAALMELLECRGLRKNAIIDIDQHMKLTENEKTALQGASKLSALRVTLCNPSFVATMMKMLAESSTASINTLRVFFRVAEAGAISDIMSRREVEVLNDLTFIRGDGSSPAFNAKHFSTFGVPHRTS